MCSSYRYSAFGELIIALHFSCGNFLFVSFFFFPSGPLFKNYIFLEFYIPSIFSSASTQRTSKQFLRITLILIFLCLTPLISIDHDFDYMTLCICHISSNLPKIVEFYVFKLYPSRKNLKMLILLFHNLSALYNSFDMPISYECGYLPLDVLFIFSPNFLCFFVNQVISVLLLHVNFSFYFVAQVLTFTVV